MSRNKGARYEREVAKVLTKYGFFAQRTPRSGGGTLKGDLVGYDMAPCIPGLHLECKHQETLCIPEWLRQSYADAGHNIPAVVFRKNDRRDGDPVGKSHIIVPLEDFAAFQQELRELRAAVAAREAA